MQADCRVPCARFGEGLDSEVMSSAYEALESCDLFMTIGTSSVVYPAAGFAQQVLCWSRHIQSCMPS